MDDQKEVVDERYTEDPFANKICPLIKEPCKKAGCMAYASSPTEWDDTKLEDGPEDVDGVTVNKTHETITGIRYSGVVHQCNAGIFDRKVTDVQIIKSESHEIKKESSIILLDQG